MRVGINSNQFERGGHLTSFLVERLFFADIDRERTEPVSAHKALFPIYGHNKCYHQPVTLIRTVYETGFGAVQGHAESYLCYEIVFNK